jgi:hypothetical protein
MLSNNELRNLASRFEDRVGKDHLMFAMEYLEYGENCLALETLCDYLCEAEASLNESELQELLRIATLVGANLEAGRFKYLEQLSRPTSN